MPGLQPKEKTHVGPEPLEYTASLKMFCIMSRSSVMSAHTSNPEFIKCTPRDLHSFQMECVSMRVASSITTSPLAGAIWGEGGWGGGEGNRGGAAVSAGERGRAATAGCRANTHSVQQRHQRLARDKGRGVELKDAVLGALLDLGGKVADAGHARQEPLGRHVLDEAQPCLAHRAKANYKELGWEQVGGAGRGAGGEAAAEAPVWARFSACAGRMGGCARSSNTEGGRKNTFVAVEMQHNAPAWTFWREQC